MKTVGLFSIMVAAICLSLTAIQRKTRHVTALQAVIALLCDYQRRLQYTAPPIKIWLQDAVQSSVYRALSFLSAVATDTADFSAAWEVAVLQHGTLDGFTADERQILCVLGTHLGTSDAATQSQAIGEGIAALKEQLHKAGEQKQKADRLYVSLGMGGGLALVILLI